MLLLFIYACALFVAILISERAERTVLSSSVLFLVTGAVASEYSLGILHLNAEDPIISTLAELALFIVLLTDGMKLSLRELWAGSRLPGRALIFGLPLTIGGTAALAHYIAQLDWLPSVLLAAILSPTDPVLVSAIVGRQKIPQTLRHLLNIESGFNDGLALPIVVVTLRLMSGQDPSLPDLASELGMGVALGVAVPWLIVKSAALPVFGVSQRYTPLMPVAAGTMLFAVCSMVHANEYVAAFTAGMTMASVRGDLRQEFEAFGEPIAELMKLAALLVFGALFSWEFLQAMSWRGYLFATLALVVVRPAALCVALIGHRMPKDQFAAAAWFGPKGFASVTYALMVLRTGADHAREIFGLSALVIAISIIAHSSTDVPIAGWIIRRQQHEPSLGQQSVQNT